MNRKLPFLETLDFPNLSKLINDPIMHDHFWSSIPAKLSSDIPKFDGKQEEDPKNHVMAFHILYSPKYLMYDSICLRICKQTLIDASSKWYIELLQHSFSDFNSLAMSFLTHFQLPNRYEMSTNILTSLSHFTYTHISHHIYDWR